LQASSKISGVPAYIVPLTNCSFCTLSFFPRPPSWQLALATPGNSYQLVRRV